MEVLVVFFVLVGLASALAAQTICQRDENLARRSSESICRRLEISCGIKDDEIRILGNHLGAWKNSAILARADNTRLNRENAGLTEWNESAKHLLDLVRGPIRERIDVNISFVQQPHQRIATYRQMDYRAFKGGLDLPPDIKAVEIRAEVMAYAMSLNMRAIKDEKWAMSMMEHKFSDALARHLSGKIQLV